MADYQPANSAQIVSPSTEIKEGDTNTQFKIQLLDSSSQPVDLTGATVTVYFSNQQNSLLLLQKQATLSVTPTDGTITFQFDENDATGNGTLNIQVNVVYSDGDVEKFPANGFETININPSLDNMSIANFTPQAADQFISQLSTELNTTVSTSLTSFQNTVNSEIDSKITADYIGSIGLSSLLSLQFAMLNAKELDKIKNQRILQGQATISNPSGAGTGYFRSSDPFVAVPIPSTAYAQINAPNYDVVVTPINGDGSEGKLVVSGKTQNGFTVSMTGSALSVSFLWTLINPNV